jgi:hypothetical protein
MASQAESASAVIPGLTFPVQKIMSVPYLSNVRFFHRLVPYRYQTGQSVRPNKLSKQNQGMVNHFQGQLAGSLNPGRKRLGSS